MAVTPLTRRASQEDTLSFERMYPERGKALAAMADVENTHVVGLDGRLLAFWGWDKVTRSVAEVWLVMGGFPDTGQTRTLRTLREEILEALHQGLKANPEVTRIQAVIEMNTTDANFAEHLGFKFEGRLAAYFDGEDGWMYGLERKALLAEVA